MAKKRDDQALPLNVDKDMEPSSSITYANEVVAIIAGLAASEVEGIAGMVNVNSGLKGKNKNITRGVKVEVGTEEVSVDLFLNVEYGTPIQRAAHDAQEAVKKSIESMTGLHVVRVDIHVLGVSFEKENNSLQAGAEKAVLESGVNDNKQAEKKSQSAVSKLEENDKEDSAEAEIAPDMTSDLASEVKIQDEDRD